MSQQQQDMFGSPDEEREVIYTMTIRLKSGKVIRRGCLNFCVRGARRLVHGGGRRLRRTDRRGGKVGLRILRDASGETVLVENCELVHR